MTERVDWRLRDGADSLVLIDEAERVSRAAKPDAEMLRSYLAVKSKLEDWRDWKAWRPVEAVDWNPESWGELVLSRADSGTIISIDPELFWEGIYRWFRSKGIDFGP